MLMGDTQAAPPWYPLALVDTVVDQHRSQVACPARGVGSAGGITPMHSHLPGGATSRKTVGETGLQTSSRSR